MHLVTLSIVKIYMSAKVAFPLGAFALLVAIRSRASYEISL
jgi:hypothetical protein